MADVFISKSTKDDILALSIVDVLERNGIDCWISNRDLTTNPTELYARDIVDAIIEAKAVLLILSHNSNKSRHVINEISTACDRSKKVFALQIDDVIPAKEFEYYLSQEQRIIDTDVYNTGDYTSIVTALLRYLKIEINNANFTDQEFIRKANYRKLKGETQEIRLSYSMSIADGDESEYDYKHFYEKVIRFDVVDTNKNQWSSYRFLTIRNVSDECTNHIVHKECGENKVRFSEMRIRAFCGGIEGERLSVESLTAIQPNLVQVFKINLKKPLQPGEMVTVFYRLDWPNEPNSYYLQELSQSISLSRYKEGVGYLEFGVFEPLEILSSYVMEVSGMNERFPSNLPCLILDLDDEDLLKPLHGKGLKGVKINTEKPSSILYQIVYKVDKVESNDEDFF